MDEMVWRVSGRNGTNRGLNFVENGCNQVLAATSTREFIGTIVHYLAMCVKGSIVPRSIFLTVKSPRRGESADGLPRQSASARFVARHRGRSCGKPQAIEADRSVVWKKVGNFANQRSAEEVWWGRAFGRQFLGASESGKEAARFFVFEVLPGRMDGLNLKLRDRD